MHHAVSLNYLYEYLNLSQICAYIHVSKRKDLTTETSLKERSVSFHLHKGL